MDNVNIYDARIRAGKALAASYPVEADLVTGVPDSGLAAAMGYAQACGLPFALAIHKNSYGEELLSNPPKGAGVRCSPETERTLQRRQRQTHCPDCRFYRPRPTMASLIRMLKDAGATKVHVRISSPPFLFPCYYGTDVPSNDQLIASSPHCCRNLRLYRRRLPRLHEAGGLEADDRGSSTLQSML